MQFCEEGFLSLWKRMVFFLSTKMVNRVGDFPDGNQVS